MIPTISTSFGKIPTFPIFIVIGVLSFFLVLHISLLKADKREKEEEFILPRLVLCGMVAWFFAGVFDAIFKYFKYGVFEFRGITFYGGLIGAIISICVLLYGTYSNKKTEYRITEWLDILTLPLVSFHFFGRLGCFFGGCCYGKMTNCYFGIDYPYYIDGMLQYFVKRYPTQLFEAFLLVIIFVIVSFCQNKSIVYLLCYSIGRFFIEYLRGDDRGDFFINLSPAQLISILLFSFSIILILINRYKNKIIAVNAPN